MVDCANGGWILEIVERIDTWMFSSHEKSKVKNGKI